VEGKGKTSGRSIEIWVSLGVAFGLAQIKDSKV
jgi:hypothetical protein